MASAERKTDSTSSNVRVGVAGWSYPDWNGIVYPPHKSRFDALAYLTRFVDCLEINSSFYRIPTAGTTASWARRASESRDDFRLTLKLFRGFTHGMETTESDRTQLHRAIEPLASAGVLGGVLAQFPWSFKHTDENVKTLVELFGWIKRYRLVVEVRHASWESSDFRELLVEHDVGLCNIDQPVVGQSLRPSRVVTAEPAYVRLHGRNYGNWFAEGAGRDARYDYLYREEELDPWLDRINDLKNQASETFVITNNHFRGQAVVNALQIRYRLSRSRGLAPAPLLEAYPQLRPLYDADESTLPAQRSLFGPSG